MYLPSICSKLDIHVSDNILKGACDLACFLACSTLVNLGVWIMHMGRSVFIGNIPRIFNRLVLGILSLNFFFTLRSLFLFFSYILLAALLKRQNREILGQLMQLHCKVTIHLKMPLVAMATWLIALVPLPSKTFAVLAVGLFYYQSSYHVERLIESEKTWLLDDLRWKGQSLLGLRRTRDDSARDIK